RPDRPAPAAAAWRRPTASRKTTRPGDRVDARVGPARTDRRPIHPRQRRDWPEEANPTGLQTLPSGAQLSGKRDVGSATSVRSLRKEQRADHRRPGPLRLPSFIPEAERPWNVAPKDFVRLASGGREPPDSAARGHRIIRG